MTTEPRPHGPWSPGAIGRAEALVAGDPEWFTVNASPQFTLDERLKAAYWDGEADD